MIVVLADDLSGAAELANVAARHGLSAEVQTDFEPRTEADVVCLDTDTRLLPAEAAAFRVGSAAAAIVAAQPAWIFKKCDSLLRGAVVAEARAVAATTGHPRIMVAPANPSRGRVVRGGRYFVEGRLLAESPLAGDPAHPRLSSELERLLGGDLAGIETPDAGSDADLGALAARTDAAVLPVGAADYFSALLAHREKSGNHRYSPPPHIGPTLLVCGSAASWSQRRAEAAARGVPIIALRSADALSETTEALRSRGCALFGIESGRDAGQSEPATHLADLAFLVARIRPASSVRRLLVEGGATASAVLGILGWRRFQVAAIGESGIGIVRPLEVEDAPWVWIKPGSYPWPPESWP